MSDISLLAIVLLLGVMVGVVGTVAVYQAIAAGQVEEARREADEAVQAAREERDQLQAKINDYLESERAGQQQAAAEEAATRPAPPPPAQPPVVAAAPRPEPAASKKEELLPVPREDSEKPAATPRPSGFGPPKDFSAK
jgi:hypothetical protein